MRWRRPKYLVGSLTRLNVYLRREFRFSIIMKVEDKGIVKVSNAFIINMRLRTRYFKGNVTNVFRVYL